MVFRKESTLNKRALIIIDVQRGLFEKKTEVYESAELIYNINSLLDIFRREEDNIIFIQHCNNSSLKNGSMDWQIHPEIKVTEQDVRICKNKSDVFKENKLIDFLKKENIKDIVIVGLVTQGCIQAACLSGKEIGLNITLIGDAHSNFNKNPKEIINKWNKKLDERGICVINTDEFIY
jgi:nicotinamidase-related amidase